MTHGHGTVKPVIFYIPSLLVLPLFLYLGKQTTGCFLFFRAAAAIAVTLTLVSSAVHGIGNSTRSSRYLYGRG